MLKEYILYYTKEKFHERFLHLISDVDFKTAVMEDMEDDVLIHLNSSGENKQKLVRNKEIIYFY